MGLRVKSKECPEHGPVLAVRQGHAIRNSLINVATVSPLGSVGKKWLCPNCGRTCK